MPSQRSGRRPYGTGCLLSRSLCWYGQFRVGGRLVKRRLGRQRSAEFPDGLTRKQAERELRRVMAETSVVPTGKSRTMLELGEAYIGHAERTRGLRPTTVADYRSILCHLQRYFGEKAIDRLSAADLEAYMAAKRAEGLSRKTVRNHVIFAGSCFVLAAKRRWIAASPLDAVDLPRVHDQPAEIRYLSPVELSALVEAVPDDKLGVTDRLLYTTAAWSGLRQGELLALRWSDVDYSCGLIRVRRSITRGRIGPPKSRRGIRTVPLSERLANQLQLHRVRSRYTEATDLVFPHPDTGNPYDASKQRKRFKQAALAAGLRPVRFHDLRHTFGTAMAGVGVPMRTLQEWMGHRDIKTTEIYVDYSPSPVAERKWVERAFGPPRSLAGPEPENEEDPHAA